jgi:hypothetical protein
MIFLFSSKSLLCALFFKEVQRSSFSFTSILFKNLPKNWHSRRLRDIRLEYLAKMAHQDDSINLQLKPLREAVKEQGKYLFVCV